MKDINKIGIVAMPRISVGGGFARVTIDIINALSSMNKKIYLLTPFEVDMDKIKDLYGTIKIKKIFYPNKIKSFFSREEILGRKLIKREFIKMTKEVDFIIDMDGGVLHRYLPKKFNKSRYIIWRVSCINPDTYKMQEVKNPKTLVKIRIKKIIKKLITNKKDIPKNVKIYPLDEWTKREIIKFWKVNPEKMCLYPEIKVNEFRANGKKENLIAVLGRITPNKSIDNSIKIFAEGTKKYSYYKIIILGGVTPDSENYIDYLNSLTENLGIKDKVKIIKDPSFNKIKEVLSKSKIIIDSQRGVSLTMTAIEALAAGCIVLAHKTGGTYTEVLENGKYGYGFESVGEGSRNLREILEKVAKKKINIEKFVNRAKFFSSEKFKERLGGIING